MPAVVMAAVHASCPAGSASTTSTAVALVPPAGGFTATVVENESLCFFDSSSWSPSLILPNGC